MSEDLNKLRELAEAGKAAEDAYERDPSLENYNASEAADLEISMRFPINETILSLLSRLQAAEERAEKVETENAQLKLTASWAKSFGAAHDMMQDALKAISYHADNQNIGHIDYRMHTKQQADFALEQCAGSPGLLDPAPTPKPDWTDGQWKWADEECAALKTEGA